MVFHRARGQEQLGRDVPVGGAAADQVIIPRYRLVGWALTAGPIVLVATLSGPALAITTGIAAGVLLLGTALAGFRDLARIRAARRPAA